MNFRLAPVCTLFLAVLSASAEAPPAQIDLSKFQQATTVENVVVPIPSEIFTVLDKIGTPNWKAELRDDKIVTGKRYQIALLLGTVIAEGFVAVEATDREKVKNIGRDVLNLSGPLGVRDRVLGRSNSIIEKADVGDWQGVKRELDGALHDVRAAMNDLNDDRLAQLVSLGGWLRGTEVLTSVLSKGYSKDGADLLHQPELLNYFQTQLAGMPPDIRRSSLVNQISRRLDEISPLIQSNDISKESVSEIKNITGDLVKSIVKKSA